MRPGAIFDLDGTLIRGISAERLFVPYLRERGILGLRQWIPFLSRASLLPVLGRTRSVRRNKWYLHDLSIERVLEVVPEFLDQEIVGRLCAPSVARLEALLDEGRPVCILTGSPDILATAIAERLGIHEGLGTRLETRGGRFTGRLAGPHYFGEKKVEGVRELAERHRIDLAVSVGFADHDQDVPFLECFGQAVAVDPQDGLERRAQERNWEIVRCANGLARTR